MRMRRCNESASIAAAWYAPATMPVRDAIRTHGAVRPHPHRSQTLLARRDLMTSSYSSLFDPDRAGQVVRAVGHDRLIILMHIYSSEMCCSRSPLRELTLRESISAPLESPDQCHPIDATDICTAVDRRPWATRTTRYVKGYPWMQAILGILGNSQAAGYLFHAAEGVKKIPARWRPRAPPVWACIPFPPSCARTMSTT